MKKVISVVLVVILLVSQINLGQIIATEADQNNRLLETAEKENTNESIDTEVDVNRDLSPIRFKENIEVTHGFEIHKNAILLAEIKEDGTILIDISGNTVEVTPELIEILSDGSLEKGEYSRFKGKEDEDIVTELTFLEEDVIVYGNYHDDQKINISEGSKVYTIVIDGKSEAIIIGDVLYYFEAKTSNEDELNEDIEHDSEEDPITIGDEPDNVPVNGEEVSNDIDHNDSTEKGINDDQVDSDNNKENDPKGDNIKDKEAIEDREKPEYTVQSTLSSYFTISSSDAILYSISSGKYEPIAKLTKGQSFHLRGTSGNYFKVYFGGSYGYIHKGHVTFTGEKPPYSADSNRTGRYFTTITDVTVYENSTGSFKKLGVLPEGVRMSISSISNNFYKVNIGDRYGFVYKSGVQFEFTQKDEYIKVIRKGASVYNVSNGFKKIGELAEGETYKTVDHSGRYHKVKFGDQFAYVHEGNTEIGYKKNIPKLINSDTQSGRHFVAKVDLNVYDNSTGSFNEIATIKKGQTFSIVSESSNFYRVSLGSRTGFVYKSGTNFKFLDSDKYFKVITNSATVYDLSTGSYVPIAKLKKGQTFLTKRISGNYHVIDMGDYDGVVHISNTELLKSTNIKNIDNSSDLQGVFMLMEDAPVYDNSTGSFVKMGTLNKDVTYSYISRSTNYYKVVFGDRIGYVNRKYSSNYQIDYTNYNISLNQAVKNQMSLGYPQTTDYSYAFVHKNFIDRKSSGKGYPFTGVVTATSLNIRDFPSSSSSNINIYGQLRQGSQVQVVKEATDNSNWYKIVNPFKSNPPSLFVNADSDLTKYYMNPKNFVDNPRQQFQFLRLDYYSSISKTEINKLVSGKGILNGKGSAFMTAAQSNNLNEVYLVSHAILETGHGTSELANGISRWVERDKSGNVVYRNGKPSIIDLSSSGKKVYNMYGYGAFDGCAHDCGAQYAYDNGWFSPEEAIIGGASDIGKNYINSTTYKQNTLYKMKWNPAYWVDSKVKSPHQYATDIGWAYKQVSNISNLYNQLDNYVLYLDVPKYK